MLYNSVSLYNNRGGLESVKYRGEMQSRLRAKEKKQEKFTQIGGRACYTERNGSLRTEEKRK
jgi:hypothetical protein